jgi:hypothetical protein
MDGEGMALMGANALVQRQQAKQSRQAGSSEWMAAAAAASAR